MSLMTSYSILTIILVIATTSNPTLAADNKSVRVSKIEYSDIELIDITFSLRYITLNYFRSLENYLRVIN